MKTSKHLFILIFCCIAFQISAQFSVGVRGGYIKAWEEYGDVDLPTGAKIHVNGFQVSVLSYFEINKHFSIGLESGYAQRGAACEPGYLIFNRDTKLRLNYIEVPLMISAKFPVYRDKLEIFGKAGYGVSMMMSAFRKISVLGSYDQPVKTKLNVNNSSVLNRWDHGIYGGLGIAYNTGSNRLFVESNYYFGLKDVDRFNTSKNRSIHFGLGYLMNL